jgi:hypothetical protein
LLESGWQNLVQSGGLRHDPKDLPFVPYLKALHMLASAAKGKDMKLFAEFQRLLPQL